MVLLVFSFRSSYDLFCLILSRSSRWDLWSIAERRRFRIRRKFRYFTSIDQKFRCYNVSVFVRFSRHHPSALLTNYSFRFTGFVSNPTLSTTCQLDSRTSYSLSSSQTTGTRIEIFFCDLLLCIVILDFNCFIRPVTDSFISRLEWGYALKHNISMPSIIYRNEE